MEHINWRENQIGEDLGSALWTFIRHRVKITTHRRLGLSIVQQVSTLMTFYSNLLPESSEWRKYVQIEAEISNASRCYRNVRVTTSTTARLKEIFTNVW